MQAVCPQASYGDASAERGDVNAKGRLKNCDYDYNNIELLYYNDTD